MQAVSFRRHKLNICIMFKALHSHIWRVRQPCWDWVNGWEREQPFATTSALPARFHMARDLFLRLPEHGGQACALPRAWPRSHHRPHSTPRGFSFSLNIPPQVARRMFFLHQWPHQWRHCKIFIKTVPIVPLTHLLSGWKRWEHSPSICLLFTKGEMWFPTCCHEN